MDNNLPDSEVTRDLSALPPELQPLYRRLADDGASWQAASAEKLTALAQTLVASAERMAPATRDVASSVETSAPIPVASRQVLRATQRPLRRREWIAGVFAAAIVVVLLAIV